jgi:serine/threonine-protein kinase HipA
MDRTCLVCAGSTNSDSEYHERCSKSFFDTFPAPTLEMTLDEMQHYAATSVLARITVTGVQKKLSLGIEKNGRNARFTIVGLWGRFILKPPVEEYGFLPENEDTVMRLASLVGIPVVPHALIRLGSGELAFISKRIDRDEKSGKLAMEDFCQISGRLTEDKYKGSVELMGKLLRRYSVFPGLDAVSLFDRVVFNYLCGNADMHLKNYSLVETPQGMRLAPSYDLLSTTLAIPDDPEESALTINGKKSRLQREDFDALARNMQIPESVCRNVFAGFARNRTKMDDVLSKGRLPDAMAEKLRALVNQRMEKIGCREKSA